MKEESSKWKWKWEHEALFTYLVLRGCYKLRSREFRVKQHRSILILIYV